MPGNKDPTDLDKRLKIIGLWEERKHIPPDLRVTERLSEHGQYSTKDSASDEQISIHYSMAIKDCIKTVCRYSFNLVDEAETKQYNGDSVYQCVVGRLNLLNENMTDYPMFSALLRYVTESSDYAELRERITLLRKEVDELFSGKESVLSVLKEKKKEVKGKQSHEKPGAKKHRKNADL